jgi:hypothetical protein
VKQFFFYVLPPIIFGMVLFAAFTEGRERDDWHRQRTAQVQRLQDTVDKNQRLITENTAELIALRAQVSLLTRGGL